MFSLKGFQEENANELANFYGDEHKPKVLNNKTNINNSDEILKNYLMKKKNKYSASCPICQSKILPFKMNFQNVIFLCVNQEVTIIKYFFSFEILKSCTDLLQ